MSKGHKQKPNRGIVRDMVQIDVGNVEYVDVMMAGDTHIGDALRDPAYMRFISQWVNRNDNRYVILTGDLFNAAIVGGKSDVYGESETLNEAMGLAEEWLAGFADKIIANVDGNHDQRVDRAVGIDPVEHVCKEAHCRYNGIEAYTALYVGRNKHYSKRVPYIYDIYVTHGVGGGRTQGAKINNLIRLRDIAFMDCYVQGHQHDPQVKTMTAQRATKDHSHIENVQQLFIVTPGGLLRGGYAAAKAYAPPGWGIPVVRFYGDHKGMQPTVIDLSYDM